MLSVSVCQCVVCDCCVVMSLLQEEERKVEEERIRTENLLKGNPLLNAKTSFKIKQR